MEKEIIIRRKLFKGTFDIGQWLSKFYEEGDIECFIIEWHTSLEIKRNITSFGGIKCEVYEPEPVEVIAVESVGRHDAPTLTLSCKHYKSVDADRTRIERHGLGSLLA